MLRKLSLIFRFYRTSMLVPCVAVSVALAWLVGKWGPSIAPWCFFGKVAFTALFLYVWMSGFFRATAASFTTTSP